MVGSAQFSLRRGHPIIAYARPMLQAGPSRSAADQQGRDPASPPQAPVNLAVWAVGENHPPAGHRVANADSLGIRRIAAGP